MRRKLSICFFCAFVAGLVILLGVFEESTWRYPELMVPKEGEEYKELNGIAKPTEEEVEEEPEVIPTNKLEAAYKYIVLVNQGELVVYHSDNVTEYFRTGIKEEGLPEDVCNRLETGITFESEAELFSFLETYSS